MKKQNNHINTLNAEPTHYCDHTSPEIQFLVDALSAETADEMAYVHRAFRFAKEDIVFGGDVWRVKASETLKKGYGACYNKNVLFIALLRARQIPAVLGANPMKHTFMKPAMGSAHVSVSKPFYHCFTTVIIAEKKFIIDPTLDSRTYDTFFRPIKVDWDVSWDGERDMILYTESIDGPPKAYPDIDDALNRNLESHFIFKNEPDWLLRQWLKLGNHLMWKKTGNIHIVKNQAHLLRDSA